MSAILALSAAFGATIASAQRTGFARAFGVNPIALGLDFQTMLLAGAVGASIVLWGFGLMLLVVTSLFSGQRGHAYAFGSSMVAVLALALTFWTRNWSPAQGPERELLHWTLVLSCFSALFGGFSRHFHSIGMEMKKTRWFRLILGALIAVCLLLMLSYPIDDAAYRLQLATFAGTAAFLVCLLSIFRSDVRELLTPPPAAVARGRNLATRVPLVYAHLVLSLTVGGLAFSLVYLKPDSQDPTFYYTILAIAVGVFLLALIRSSKRGREFLKSARPIPTLVVMLMIAVVAMVTTVSSLNSGYATAGAVKATANRPIDDEPTLTEDLFGVRYYWVCPVTAGSEPRFPRSLLLSQAGDTYLIWSQSAGLSYIPVGSSTLLAPDRC